MNAYHLFLHLLYFLSSFLSLILKVAGYDASCIVLASSSVERNLSGREGSRGFEKGGEICVTRKKKERIDTSIRLPIWDENSSLRRNCCQRQRREGDDDATTFFLLGGETKPPSLLLRPPGHRHTLWRKKKGGLLCLLDSEEAGVSHYVSLPKSQGMT